MKRVIFCACGCGERIRVLVLPARAARLKRRRDLAEQKTRLAAQLEAARALLLARPEGNA